MNIHYDTSLTIPKQLPLLLGEAFFLLEDNEKRPIKKGMTKKSEWGDVQKFTVVNGKEWPVPEGIDVIWISVLDCKCYHVCTSLDKEKIEEMLNLLDKDGKPVFKCIAVSVARNGHLAVWLHGSKKQVLVAWLQGKEEVLSIEQQRAFYNGRTLMELCEGMIDGIQQSPELSPFLDLEKSLFEKMMHQYTYRLQPKMRIWNDEELQWEDYDDDDDAPVLQYVEVKRFDGTFDRTDDGSILDYHTAGKPKRISVCWQDDQRLYAAYFFFEHDILEQLFNRLNFLSPDGRISIQLLIDPVEEKFIPAMMCEDMPEPVELTEEFYDVLVFCDKFECYRNPDYHQEPDAWQWS